MKKLLIIAALATASLAACNKDHDTISRVVDVSAPAINLKGDKFVSINIGGSYADPGATLVDDISGSSSDIMAEESTLDPATPGLYYMLYRARNANGYFTTVARYIAVTNWNDAVDLSGRYRRQAAAPNNRLVTLTKKARGLYETSDMGGAGLPDKGYFTVINDSTIEFGEQYSESIGSVIDAYNEKLTIQPGDTSYRYALDAPGYGTALRTFKKE